MIKLHVQCWFLPPNIIMRNLYLLTGKTNVSVFHNNDY